MSWGRRRTALVVLAVTGPWLAACGGADPEPTPPPVVIPGSTVTIGGDQQAQTSDPAPDPDPDPDPVPEGSFGSAEELLAAIGGAMGDHATVRMTVTGSDGRRQVADYDYLAGDDYVALQEGQGAVLAEYRRIGDELYYRLVGSQEWQRFVAGEGPLEPLLREAAAYSLLGDLRRQLARAQDLAFVPDGPTDVGGTPVETYAFTLEPTDLSADPTTAALMPAGDVDVVYSVTADGLPVRASFTFDDGRELVEDFSGWGDPVAIEVPDVG